MKTNVEKILKHRVYWHNKLVEQINELMFVSLEGDTKKHDTLVDAIGTSIIIIWRFDRDLENAKTLKD